MRYALRLTLTLSALALGCGEEDADYDAPADSAASGAAASDTLGIAAGADTTDSTETAADPAKDQPVPEPDATEPWREAPVLREKGGVHAVLTAVRTARHVGHDRIVFEFDSEVPGYAIRYVEDPVACGSGYPVETGAPASLEVDFRSAAAHDDAGAITVREREMNPGYPALRTARITCDFEGIVAWVLGVDRRAPIRVLELASPARLVIDLRHR